MKEIVSTLNFWTLSPFLISKVSHRAVSLMQKGIAVVFWDFKVLDALSFNVVSSKNYSGDFPEGFS